QQGALPDARRADDRHHLARVDLQIEITKHGQGPAADRVALDQPARVKKRHGVTRRWEPRRHEEERRTRRNICTKSTKMLRDLRVASCLRGSGTRRHSYRSACTGSSFAAWRDG